MICLIVIDSVLFQPDTKIYTQIVWPKGDYDYNNELFSEYAWYFVGDL